MIKRIDELTPDQVAAQKAYVEEWIAIGNSTDPIDRPAAELAFRDCYRFDGRAQVPIVWVDSPDAAIRIVGENNRYMHFGGNLWGDWCAFERYFTKHCELEHKGDLAERARAYADSCRHAHLWWPFDNVIVACERPQHIKTDRDGRTHCEDGPAILYRDGWGIYCWHGTNFPGEWIQNGVSVDVALTWQNIEQRRVACEIVGWDALLGRLGARMIDDSGDPETGQLLEADLPDVGICRFLRVQCGTGRTFAITVPEHTRTALEAQAVIHDIDFDAFAMPEVRT